MVSSKAVYSHRLEQENNRAAAVESVKKGRKNQHGEPKTQVAILLYKSPFNWALNFIGWVPTTNAFMSPTNHTLLLIHSALEC